MFVEPWPEPDPRDCHFYHVMELPGLGTVGGDWDLRPTLDSYLGPCPLAGRSFLDLGCASGFLSFEAERRGARSVVSFDMADARTDLVPVPYAGDDEPGAQDFHAGAVEHTERIKRAYWLAHHRLKSQAQAAYGTIYRLPEALGRFDVVMLGQVLVHLHDPIRGLAAAARAAGQHLIIVEAVIADPEPKALFMSDVANRARYAWWRFSLPLFHRVLAILGFEIEHVAAAAHRCLAIDRPGPVELATITARRH